MAQMNVSVPDPMKDWCEQQVTSGRYSTTSDYVRDLIRKDQDTRMSTSVLQALADEGLSSGVSERSLDEIFDLAKERAAAALLNED